MSSASLPSPPQGVFSFCSLHVAVTLQASAELSVDGTNGRITAERLTGAIDIGTTNGSLELGRVTGRLDVHTTNGTIRVRDASSDRVAAQTTNGAVELAFHEAPAEASPGGLVDDPNEATVDPLVLAATKTMRHPR